MATAGIYEIVNMVDGRNTTYVGSSISVKTRWSCHKHQLRNGTHPNCYLQRAWKKYGETAFVFRWLEIVEDVSRLVEQEQRWLDTVRLAGPVYNLRSLVTRPVASAEGRLRIGEANRGRVVSDETRRKLSENSKRRWAEGLYNTSECRRRRSEAQKGRVISEEHRRKISEGLKGRRLSPEQKYAAGNAMRGKNHSQATKDKMSAAAAQPYPAFVNVITGERLGPGVNLQSICKERGLPKSAMCRVKNGRARSYKGWMLKGTYEELFDEQLGVVRDKRARIYPRLINAVTGEVIPPGWNLSALCRARNLPLGGINAVIHGRQKAYRGWQLEV